MLPPAKYEPVGIAFVTGSISAPGFAESLEHKFPKDHPLRPLFLADRTDGKAPDTAINLTMRGGVRAALEYSKSRDLARTRAAANPDNAPNVEFLDWAGHGYSAVRAGADALETEFVCIQRPAERNTADDGGPLRYRVVSRTPLWRAGEAPKMSLKLLEGDAGLSMA
jgi:alkaline phosphatase D